MKRRQTRIDDTTWQLFVRACGGRCCECRKDKELQQGHLQRHADGGQLIFENLIPLCKSCNAKHSKEFTRDSRPDDWRDAFFKLLLAENGIGLRWQPHAQGGNHIGAMQAADATAFVDLQQLKFVEKNSYITTCEQLPPTEPLSESAARALLRQLFEKSKECAIRPKRAFAKRQDQMMLFAIRNGSEAFRIAGEEFLRESPCPWVVGDENRGGYAQADSWQHFCESFDDYLKDGRARRVRIAAQERKAEADRKEAEIRTAEAARAVRWSDYIRIDVPPWPEITEEDKTFVLAVAAEKADAGSEVRDVSDERLNQSYAVFRRYKSCERDALIKGKDEIYGGLNQCVLFAKRFNDARQQEEAERIKTVRELVDRAKTLEDLKQPRWMMSDLLTELDPDTPEFDGEF